MVTNHMRYYYGDEIGINNICDILREINFNLYYLKFLKILVKHRGAYCFTAAALPIISEK